VLLIPCCLKQEVPNRSKLNDTDVIETLVTLSFHQKKVRNVTLLWLDSEMSNVKRSLPFKFPTNS
jgi:hypothetical protein